MSNKVLPYKYKIHYFLRRMNVDDYKAAVKELPVILGIHSDTLRNWTYIKENEGKEIPGTAIIKMAAFFNVQPVEMFQTSPVPQNIQELLSQRNNENHVQG